MKPPGSPHSKKLSASHNTIVNNIIPSSTPTVPFRYHFGKGQPGELRDQPAFVGPSVISPAKTKEAQPQLPTPPNTDEARFTPQQEVSASRNTIINKLILHSTPKVPPKTIVGKDNPDSPENSETKPAFVGPSFTAPQRQKKAQPQPPTQKRGEGQVHPTALSFSLSPYDRQQANPGLQSESTVPYTISGKSAWQNPRPTRVAPSHAAERS